MKTYVRFKGGSGNWHKSSPKEIQFLKKQGEKFDTKTESSPHWNLRTKEGKFRSRASFKRDMAQDSQEEWEIARRNKINPFLKF